jgi:CHAT domain-containing protein
VERHLAECDECREVLADTAAFLREEANEHGRAAPGRPVPLRRFPRRVSLIGGTALALAATVLLAVRILDIGRFGARTTYDDLIAAVGSSRPVDGRLWGFAYGQSQPVTRGEATSPLSKNWEVLSAAARIKSAAEADPSATNLHSLGVAHLVLGEYDDAVRNLEMAVAQNATDARAHSDLAVAYATRASRLQRTADSARSLAAAERALQSDPDLVEAYFNRALALEALSLNDQARAAWQEYLAKDPDGPWAAEARARLERRSGGGIPSFDTVRPELDGALARGDAATVERIVAAYPLAANQYFLTDVVARWSTGVLAADDATTGVRPIRVMADALSRRGSDRTARAIVDRIDAASPIGPPIRALALTHRTFVEGDRLQREDRVAEARAVFSRCGPNPAADDPIALECAFGATAGSLNVGNRAGSRTVLATLAASAERGRYLDLLGRIQWRLALFDAFEGNLTGALALYRRALEAFNAANVTEHEANVHSLMSEILRMMGDVEGAWRQHLAAIEASANLWTPSIRHQVLVQALLTSLEAGMPEVALHVVQTLIEADRAWGHQPSLALAWAHRARAMTQLGRQADALQSLDEALRTVAGVPDPDYQRRFETEVHAARVAVFGSARPREALAAAEQGLENVRYTRAVVREPGFLFARANAQASLGNLDAAERDYLAALAGLEAERDRLSPDTIRISHLERSFAQVRAFVEFQLTRRKDDARALEVLEQSRARWLLSAVHGVNARPVSTSELAGAIAPDTAIVYYGVIADGVHAWVLTSAGLVHRRLQTTAPELEALVHALWTTVQLGGPGERARLTDLHTRLIAPVRDAVGTRTRLVIVPDGPVFNVPVAALIDARTGRYLIEDVSVSISPSLTLAPLHAEPRMTASFQPRAVGVFGGNVPDKPFLAELDAEKTAVAAVYGAGVTRRYHGDKREFLDNAGRHDLVHFAGHAVPNVSDPALSRLEFPSHDGLPTGDVLAQEVLNLDLTRVRVVVLGACRTGWGANVAGEGILSLSHAFLGAGARAVLGSLWDVEDRATRDLLTAVHQAMARGETLTDAVRTAQLRALGSSDPALRRPAAWAGFVATVRS